MKTVNDMYNEASTKDKMLLSGYRADFWDDYRQNHKRYDKLFRRMFKSFYYFLQEHDETVEEITDNFMDDVYNHLLIHDKKYSELFRINVLADTDYSLTDNYNITEIMNKDGTSLSTNTYGARTDSTTEVEGNRTDSNISVSGAREDETNTTYGARNDTTDTTSGSRTDTSNVSYGQQSNSNTSKVAPYDSENFANNTRNEENLGAKIDETTNVKGSEIDNVSFNKGQETDRVNLSKGAETDTDNFTKGEQTNTNNFTKGSQTDGLDNTYSEDYTLTRKGNIGVQTVTDMLDKHKKFWSLWDFYYYVFMEISKELLSI